LDTSKVLGGEVPTNQTKPIKELGALTGNVQTGKVICKFSAKDGRQARALDALAMTILQTVVPIEMQGRVTSVTVSLAHAAQPIGMVLSGIITVFIGTANFFLGCAGLGLMILTLSWFFTEIKHVEKPEENPTKEVD
jgi:MFS family permease